MIRERQREGIAAARKLGKRIGAKPKLPPEQISELTRRVAASEQKKVLAQEFCIIKQTLYQFVVKPRPIGRGYKTGTRGAFRGAAIRLSACKCFASLRRSLVDLPSGRRDVRSAEFV